MYRSGTTLGTVGLKNRPARLGGAPYLKQFSIIFVYSNESAKSPTQVAPLDETFTSSKRGYFRVLQVAGEKFIPSHHEANAPELDPLPKVLDHDGIHDGIDDGIFEKVRRFTTSITGSG
jgi:hypothetical protein